MRSIHSLIDQIRRTEKSRSGLFSFFFQKRLRKKLTKLHQQLDDVLIDLLSEKNERFQMLAEENAALISNSEITFKVTNEGSSPWTIMTSRFEARIHNNGFLYLKAVHTVFEFKKTFGTSYPRQYSGTINPAGLGKLRAVSKSFQIFGGRVPEIYLGSINKQGEIEITTTESWFEIDGHIHVDRIIADPFNGNGEKRKTFLNNRREMSKIRLEWKRENNLIPEFSK